MDRKAAKELLHIKGWLERVDEIVERGREAYLADDLLQEAGDSNGWSRDLSGLLDDERRAVPQQDPRSDARGVADS